MVDDMKSDQGTPLNDVENKNDNGLLDNKMKNSFYEDEEDFKNLFN